MDTRTDDLLSLATGSQAPPIVEATDEDEDKDADADENTTPATPDVPMDEDAVPITN